MAYVCGICKELHDNLDSYLKCVSTCVEKKKKEKEYLEKLNSDLNGVKQAEAYYYEKLNEFRTKYPKEFELNFGTKECDKENTVKETKAESIELSYESNGKDKPKMSAKVNGKDVNDKYIKQLLDNPDTKWIAQMLGI